MSPALPDKDIDRLVKYWWTCWAGMHWAFRRHAAVYWACSGTISPTEALEVLGIDHPHPLEIVVFHRELVTTLVSEYDLANQIVKMTPEPEIKELRRFFAGRNAFASAEGSRNTVAQLIDAVTTPKGFPKLRMTDDGQAGRVPSARMVFDGIRRTSLMRSPNPPQNQDSAPLLFISSECPELISTLPSLIADTKRDPEDVMSLGTMQDDVWESCKNTYRDYPSVRDIEPLEVRRQKFIERAVTPTGQYMNMLKFNQEHSASNKRNRKR